MGHDPPANAHWVELVVTPPPLTSPGLMVSITSSSASTADTYRWKKHFFICAPICVNSSLCFLHTRWNRGQINVCHFLYSTKLHFPVSNLKDVQWYAEYVSSGSPWLYHLEGVEPQLRLAQPTLTWTVLCMCCQWIALATAPRWVKHTHMKGGGSESS